MAAGMAASRPGSQPASRPKSRAGRRDLPVVVARGAVDPALAEGVLDRYCRLVAAPGDADLAVAAGAIVRAGARVDQEIPA